MKESGWSFRARTRTKEFVGVIGRAEYLVVVKVTESGDVVV